MATKAKPTRRRATVSKQQQFTGLKGIWQAVAAFGVIGCMAATNMYQTLWVAPKSQSDHVAAIGVLQKSFTDATEKAQKAYTDSIETRSQAAYTHGDKAVERLASAIDKVGDKFGSVQSVTQGKQTQIIDRIDRTNVLLEKQLGVAPESVDPEWVPVKPRPPKKME